jgi:sugar lactone lactonase YvrE
VRTYSFNARTGFLLAALAGALSHTATAQTSVVAFGTVSIGSNSTETVTLTNLSSTPASFVLTYGVEFAKTSTPSCSGTPVSCSVQVEFTPQSAGWRQDGLLAENGSGTILGSALLYGVGQGAQPIFLPGVISTLAGTYVNGGAGGYSTTAVNGPNGMAVDPQGKYVYFADQFNDVIRRMDTTTGVLTVYAGEFVPDGYGYAIGAYSGDGGQATSARLNNPSAVALDAAGDLYISDDSNNVIRKVDPTGIITTVAGEYSRGGTFYGDGGAATSAGLDGPTAVAVDTQGNLYIVDQGNNRIRKVTLGGIISTFAGNGTAGTSGDGGAATSAELYYPSGVVADSAGNVYISEFSNDVRKVTTDGKIHDFAGVENGSGTYSGDGGAATSAQLSYPAGISIDAAGNVYIVDEDNCVIREVDTSGVIHTVAGNYSDGAGYSGDNGAPTSAQLNYPQGIAVAPNGSMFIADSQNNVMRAVSYAAPTFSFTATNIGSESSSKSTTIENIGNAAMPFTGLSVSTNFVQTASGGTDCSASTNLAVDGTCEIAIALEPEAAGSLSGDVTVTSGAFEIPLDGTGNGPGASTNPTSLSFGNQTISTTSTAQTVTLTNSGNQTLTISSISITGTNSGDFSQTNNCGSSLSSNGNCSISVTFTPSATGSRSASLSISDNAAGSPQAVSLTGTGTGTPQISFSPTSWSFGNQVVSTSSTAESITVTNPGNASLTISSVTITGTNSGDFSQTNNCSTVAAGSGSCTIQVTFTPSATGSRSASISVSDNASGSPHTVSLSGTGTAPQISFSPSSWGFGNQLINTSSTAESITVTNPGTATLTVSGVSITGTNAGDFSQTNNCSTVAAGSGSCTIQVTFTPSAAGSRSASISVSDNASGSPHTVALTGTGTAPQISFSPSSWSFGNQLINTSSTAESITVTNPGTATLTISAVSITGTNAADFSQTNNCSTVAAGSGSCTIQVTFTPSATGSRSASISVTDSASGSPHTVSLSGTGTAPQISFSPSSWSFGNQPINTSSTAESITVTNPGTATLTISGVSITGTNAGDFSQTNNCSTVAAGSGSCTIQVTFTPSATGSRSASISVTDSAAGSPHTVTLTGTGTAAQISFSPTSWSFGNQLFNTSSTAESITVTNPGTATLTISGVSITGTNAGDFSQTNNCSTVAAGSGSCTIQVTFTPSATGSRSASISVADSAAGSPHTVSLTGTGTQPQIGLSPNPLSFSNQLINTSSTAESIIITNPGTATLSISGIAISGTNAADFSQTNNCTTVAAGSGSCTIQVTFTPSAIGTRSASISITDSAPGSPHTVSLSGTSGVPQLSMAPGSLSFGSQVIKTASAAKTVTISNTGTYALSVTSISIGGTNAADFSQTNNCAAVVPSASCSVSVTYTPSAAGSGTANLSVTDNVTGSPQSLSLSGTGVIPGNPTISIDTPSSLSGPFEGSASFVGWAVDNYSSIVSVTAAVDGAPRGVAAYGASRADVCQSMPNGVGCPNVGWTLTLDTGLFSNGSHTLSMTATTADGRSSTVSASFTVANWSTTGNAMSIDIDKPIANGPALTGVTQMGGWAIDGTAAIASVQISIDGVPQGNATYGGSRADVCAVYPNRPGCPNVGWNYTLNTRLLTDGTHTLAVTGTTADGQTSTITRTITVSNASGGTSTRITIDQPTSTAGPLSGWTALGGWAIDDKAAISEVDVLVDGTFLGAATYGGIRTDVCTVYPGRPGCPNVGWSYFLDTTQLTDGAHMLQITAKTSTGGVTTVGASFTVANAVSATRVFIDTPSPKDGAYEGLVLMAGWALDDTSAIAKVTISVDGVPYGTAAYGLTRTDVCAAYPGRPGCPAVGWSFLLNTGQLSNGSHVLGVTATTADGRNATSSASFSVANWSPSPVNNAMRLMIDSPSPNSGALAGIAHLGGWALDDNAPITSVQVAVDNVAYGSAMYGSVRADVCSAYPNRPGCPDVGWDFFLDTTLLADGTHTLAITGVSAGGQSSTITASFTVGNLANSGMRIDIDTPTATNSPLSGLAAIGGWALDDTAGIASIEILVDNISLGDAHYGGVRNDVCAVFSGRTGCPDVGWSFFLNTTQLSNGSHTLEVTGTTTSGERATVGRTFTVAN